MFHISSMPGRAPQGRWQNVPNDETVYRPVIHKKPANPVSPRLRVRNGMAFPVAAERTMSSAAPRSHSTMRVAHVMQAKRAAVA